MDPDDVTLGELGRRVDRLDDQMNKGFEAMRNEIRNLSFVPAGVYASDQGATNQRINRLEQRSDTAEQRGWQVRVAIIMAVFSTLLTVVVAIFLGLVGLK